MPLIYLQLLLQISLQSSATGLKKKHFRDATDFTLLLDESTDEANRSELALIARLVDEKEVKNAFLDLTHVGDAKTTFSAVQDFLTREHIDISKTRFFFQH